MHRWYTRSNRQSHRALQHQQQMCPASLRLPEELERGRQQGTLTRTPCATAGAMLFKRPPLKP